MRTGRSADRRRPLLAALVTMLVGGILAMHALPPIAGPAMSGMPGMSGMAGMSAIGSTGGTAATAATVGHAVATSPMVEALAERVAPAAPPSEAMLMLCVAVLTALGALTALLLLLGRHRPAWWSLPRPPLSRGLLPWPVRATDAGPPSVWAFSVVRC